MIDRDYKRARCAAALLAILPLAGCVGITRPPSAATVAAVPMGGQQVFAAGDIADCARRAPADSMAARTASLVPAGAIVLGLGDMAYPYGDAATLASCYEPTWGQHRATTLAIAGNHDYVRGSARGFRDYFGVPLPPDSDFIGYARELNEHWLLVALDSNVSGAALDAQYRWLQQTLADHRNLALDNSQRCMLVMWHAPLFSSGLHRGAGDRMRPFWQLLDEQGADVVLSGHEHMYERFGPLDAEGRMPTDGDGPRQFVVGTGGARLYGFWRPPYRSESRVLEHGVLRLSLEPGGFAWQFIDVDHKVRDAGSARCRTALNSGNVPDDKAAATALK